MKEQTPLESKLLLIRFLLLSTSQHFCKTYFYTFCVVHKTSSASDETLSLYLEILMTYMSVCVLMLLTERGSYR